MPLSNTPHLNLYRPEGSDPFSRVKFNETWDTLDASPGVLITTFNTRPVWNTAQKGRTLYETDTGRFLSWTGTAWVEPQFAPKTYSASGYWNSAQGNNTTVDRTILSFTTTRPASAIGFVTVQTVIDGANAVEWQNFQILDGVTCSMSTHETGRYPGGIAGGGIPIPLGTLPGGHIAPSSTSASGTRDVRQTTSLWYRGGSTPALPAGAHKITNRTIVFGGNNGINAYSFKIIVMLVQ